MYKISKVPYLNKKSLIKPRKKVGIIPKALITIGSISLVAIIGLIDYKTGEEINISVFYILPIFLVSWYVHRWASIAVAILGASAFFMADYILYHPYSMPYIPFFNSSGILVFFLITSYALSALRKAYFLEHELARTDHLTDIANGRYFVEIISKEIERMERYKHSLSLAYMDIDNFKNINDNYGHNMGDIVLSSIALAMKESIRPVDLVARMGGDEFAILFPETDQSVVKSIMSRVQIKINKTISENSWPISFSIGVVTCSSTKCTADLLFEKADAVMYSIKKTGKNLVKYEKL
ncbi:MAG: diguanylate cyclase [Elusimicrobia bacterium]|nr:diguanylate cyclase [Elusimicrobiota bacterium]